MDDQLTNEKVYALLYPNKLEAVNPRKEPDYNYIHKELAKPGVNLTLLWTEYCSDCYASKLTPYMYTQFCDKYRRWARITKATMRITHKPGDAMQVDWADTTIPYYDRVTGEAFDSYLFAAVLPCSCYAYVEACDDMKTTNWLLCHVHAYQYFGGVTRLLIPDNLKTGVSKNTRYETILNKSYAEMAEYYETAIIPARVRAPQDKSLAEGTVKFATTWIIAALRNRKFFSLEEVKSAVKEKLDELNKTPFKKREGCRYSDYTEEEQSFMKPLPLTPFEPTVWSTAKVPLDYLITDGKNKYSVPFDLIGEQVDIRLTKATVEVFFHGSRVASHPRLTTSRREPVVQPEHMPTEHRKYLSYNSDDFTVWAMSIGNNTARVVEAFLSSGSEPEQGYKKAMKLTAMANELQQQLKDPTTYAALGFEERLSLLTDAEWGRRQANKLARYIKNATFSTPSASIEGIEYHEDRKLNKAEILRYATCQYIIDGYHIILKGASGNGKTYLACALGNAACRKFYTVKYIRMPELLDELNVAKGCGDLKKTIKAYQKVDLLILDEWLIRMLTPQESYDLLEIAESRCTDKSTIFCTQYEPVEWYSRITPTEDSGSPISEAIID